MHFTPTSSSWLNLVERFFADLTEDVIRSGSFMSLNELVRDINAMPPPNPTPGRPKVPKSSPRSNAPALPSTTPRRLCEDL